MEFLVDSRSFFVFPWERYFVLITGGTASDCSEWYELRSCCTGIREKSGEMGYG